MTEGLLLSLASIIFLGILAQWIAWRFKLPSILLLMIFGFAAGPVAGFINPDTSFGELLFPVVSISVAVILFEGGLNLKISELRSVGNVVRNLIVFGILITWILATAAAYYILGIGFQFSVLLGAILVVTGPTVILPILRHVKPVPKLNSILKWEGIINDPIGALIAILVFEVILAAGITEATTQIVTGVVKTILISSAIGWGGGFVIMQLIKREYIPDFLENSITLAAVVGVFAASNLVQKESGLFAVTIMGIFLANQRKVKIGSIIEFKENLRVILISFLFIVLSARLTFEEVMLLDWRSIAFVAVLILIIRPAAVFLSSIGTDVSWKEKVYTSWMAPRGIVAAAVTSLFALELGNAGFEGTEIFVPVMFLIILVTIAVYGLSAIPLARWLNLASPYPSGCLILGAHPLGIEIGKILKSYNFNVIMVDTNWDNISSARMAGLNTYYGSILSDNILNNIDLSGIGKLLAITPNREVNSLAALHFSKVFGHNNVYQIKIEEDEEKEAENVSTTLQVKFLFGKNYTFSFLMEKFKKLEVKATTITQQFNLNSVKEEYGEKNFIPFFILTENSDKSKNEIRIITSGEKIKPQAGQVIIGLMGKTAE